MHGLHHKHTGQLIWLIAALLLATVTLTASGCSFDNDDDVVEDDSNNDPNNNPNNGVNNDQNNDVNNDGNNDVNNDENNDQNNDPGDCPELVCELPGSSCSEDGLSIITYSGDAEKEGCSCNITATREVTACADQLEGSRCDDAGDEPTCVNLCDEADPCPTPVISCSGRNLLVPDPERESVCDPTDGQCQDFFTTEACPEGTKCVITDDTQDATCEDECTVDSDCPDATQECVDASSIQTTSYTCNSGSCEANVVTENCVDPNGVCHPAINSCAPPCSTDDDCTEGTCNSVTLQCE